MPGDGDSDTSFTERLQGYKRPVSTALEQVKNEEMVVRETEKEQNFEEGESDDYNSEDEEEEKKNDDGPEDEDDDADEESDDVEITKPPNFDIVNVSDPTNEYHEPLQKLIDQFDKGQKLVDNDDELLFSDILYIYQEKKVIETLLAVLHKTVYLLYKDSKNTMYTPFKVKDI